MRQFLRQYIQIPIFLLFTSDKHLEEDGFRWAPRSFTRHAIGDHSGLRSFPTTEGKFLTAENHNTRRSGLYFSSPGFLIKINTGETCATTIYVQVPYSLSENRQYICNLNNSQTYAAQQGLNGLGWPAIVFGEIDNGCLGALVDINEDIEGRYFAKYISQSVLYHAKMEDVERRLAKLIAQGNDEGIRNVSGERIIFQGAKLECGQKWCVY